MKCPECGVNVNTQTSRCHSCGAALNEPECTRIDRMEELGRATKRSLPFMFLAGYILLLLLITYPLFLVFQNRQKSDRLRDNLELIMTSIKSYAREHDTMPATLQSLIDEGYITSFPDNPYHERRMQLRKPGESFAGDFSYIPIFDDTGRRVWGCILVGYGPNPNKGADIFTRGKSYDNIIQFTTEPDGKPDGVIQILQAEIGQYQV